MLFHNGRIFTGQGEAFADAFLVRDGKVSAVGTVDAVSEAAGKESAQRVDLAGAVVLPGFIDAHTHLHMFAGSLTRVQLIDCQTLEEIQALLVKARKENPTAERILGAGFRLDSLGHDVEPTRQMLDAVLPDVPVYIDAFDLHSAWCNTAALKELGVDRNTPQPKGGEFVHDADGEPTGLCKETACAEFIWPFLSSLYSPEDRVRLLDLAFEAYVSTGVTGAIDMAMTEEDLTALETAYNQRGGKLPLRVSCHWLISPTGTEEEKLARVQEAIAHRERLKECSPWLRMVGIKIISDGVIDSCTAYLSKPYANGSMCNPIWTLDELIPVIALADANDMQVAVHAIGDAASSSALDAFEKVIEINGDRPQRRHRIEHLECVSEDSVQRLARLGIVASMQPVHADAMIVPHWRETLGRDGDPRLDRAFPWTEFVDAGAKMAFGTDAPTAPHYPLANVYLAVTRRSALDPKGKVPHFPVYDKFRLPLGTSLGFASGGAAHSCRSDHYCGSLQEGLSADFCILDCDPFNGERGVKQLLSRSTDGVRETWVAGERVYQRRS